MRRGLWRRWSGGFSATGALFLQQTLLQELKINVDLRPPGLVNTPIMELEFPFNIFFFCCLFQDTLILHSSPSGAHASLHSCPQQQQQTIKQLLMCEPALCGEDLLEKIDLWTSLSISEEPNVCGPFPPVKFYWKASVSSVQSSPCWGEKDESAQPQLSRLTPTSTFNQ